MEFRDYLSLLRRNLPVLLILPLLAATVAYFVTNSEQKLYSTSAEVLLRPNDPNERLGSSSGIFYDISASSSVRYLTAQASIAMGPAVRKAVAAKLETTSADGISIGEVGGSLGVSTSSDANILIVSAVSTDPERAALIANAASAAYIENRRAASVEGLQRAIDDLDENLGLLNAEIVRLSSKSASPATDAVLGTARSQLQILSEKRQGLAIDVNLKKGEAEQISVAGIPSVPISPKPLRTSLLALFATLMFVVGLILLKDRLDVRLRDRHEAENLTGLTTLAELPLDKTLVKAGVGVSAIDDSQGLIAESVRSLRVSLRFLALDQPCKSILITSAVPGDGKSTLAINLAASYAEAGARTLLVSADLRRPHVEKLAKTSTKAGLVETLTALAYQAEQDRKSGLLPRQPTRQRKTDEFVAVAPSPLAPPSPRIEIVGLCEHEVENLWVLPAGQPVASPVEILGSPVMKDFFQLAGETFDMIIVDSPPVIPVSDSLVLSQFVDGVVFVTSVRKTPRQLLERGVQLLSSSSTRVLGLVVNRTPTVGGYYGGYQGYGETTNPRRRDRVRGR